MSFPNHGALTDALFASLQTSLGTSPVDPLVGDGVAPAGGGWLEGQPGDGVFRPYCVLVSAGASTRGMSIATYEPVVWTVGFSLRSFGGSRVQCDRMADRARNVVAGIVGTSFGQPSWRVISVEWQSLGPVVRVDSTSPAFWQVFDSVSLVVSF